VLGPSLMVEVRSPLSFEELDSLKRDLALFRQRHVPTLTRYLSENGDGFFHQPALDKHASRSSSATCISSLVSAGFCTDQYPQFWDITAAAAAKLLEPPWRSAGLEANNPFTVSFIVEGILDLQLARENYAGAAGHRKQIDNELIPSLVRHFESGHIAIKPYPPS